MTSPRHIAPVIGLGLLLVTLITAGCHKAGPVDSVDPTPGADTTSHLFTWKVEAVGTEEGSILYDVAIINDTLAYAVGEIFVRDSTGQVSTLPCNLARWNGHSWTYSTVMPRGFLYGNGTAIFAFGPDDIWAAGTVPWHWNGQDWKLYGSYDNYPGNFQIYSIWGTSSKDLYFGGERGELIHYDGMHWLKVATGTTTRLGDIWGGTNPYLGSAIALIPACWKYNLDDSRILRLYTGGVVDTMAWTPTPRRSMQSVWYSSQSKIYICGAGVFTYDGSDWKEITALPLIYTDAIRGTSPNDIIVVGDFGTVSHYNGSTWHTYPELSHSANYRALAMKNKLVIAVGDNGSSYSRAVALIGVRH